MNIRKIAVGVDFSAESELALQQAAHIAEHCSAEVILIHIGPKSATEPQSILPSVQEWERLIQSQIAEDRVKLEAWMNEVSGKGIVCTKLVIQGPPDEELANAADRLGVDLLVMGTHGRGRASNFLLGSVAQRVVRSTSRNVLIVRPGSSLQGGAKRILLATDFSPHAEQALRSALPLAAEGAIVDVIHFWQVPAPPSEAATLTDTNATLAVLKDELKHWVVESGSTLLEKFKDSGVALSFTPQEGDAASGICEWAKEKHGRYDLVVVGSHGRRGFKRFFLGSVAENVVRHSATTTLVVHNPLDEDE